MAAYNDELDKSVLEAIRRKNAEEEAQKAAIISGQASARGIAGSGFEGNQLGANSRGYINANTDAMVNLALAKAQREREDANTLQAQGFQAGESQKNRDASISEAEKQRQFQQVENNNAYERQKSSDSTNDRNNLLQMGIAGLPGLLGMGSGAQNLGLLGGLAGMGGGLINGIKNIGSRLFGGGGGLGGSTAADYMNLPNAGVAGGTVAPAAGGIAGTGLGIAPYLGGAAVLGGSAYAGQKLGNAVFKNKTSESRARTGSTLGTAVLGPMGAPVGAVLGGLSNTALASNVSDAAKQLISQPVKTIVNAPANVVKSVASVAKKIFCFDPQTPIEMSDGTTKELHEIRLGDETKGGVVESIRYSNTPAGTVFNYKGVVVTGSHAVNEDGEWKRIKDTKVKTLLPDGQAVISLVTDKHLIYINGIQFSDEFETDDYETLDINESLAYLNNHKGEIV